MTKSRLLTSAAISTCALGLLGWTVSAAAADAPTDTTPLPETLLTNNAPLLMVVPPL